MTNAIEVDHVSKHFKNFSLQDISFELPKGYIMGYVGQNGAGKTTSINLITGLYKLEEGSIRVDGMSIKENPVQAKAAIGYIGDESYYYPGFRISDVRAVMKSFYEDFDVDSFDRYIKKWELPSNKKIGEFSRGMKIKLMFAGVMARDTKILLLDEATSGLDPVTREEILAMLQDYIEDGEHSVLFSTHIMEDLEQIADYIFLIEAGREVFCRTKEELLESYALVKGGLEDFQETWGKEIIGMSKSDFGFQGVLPVEKAVGLPKEILVEKAAVNQIVVAYQRDARKEKEGL
ncbi:MAG: ABC transporter ATP-binding protein [Roseburia sp.]|nr:ABC transporter ATP-binding protein [Roseburia sp.]